MRAIDVVVLAPAAWFAVRALRRPAADPLPAMTELPMLELEIRDGAMPVRSITIYRSTTIGTAPSCGIQVRDPDVDRLHGRIDLAPDGWVVADAGSRTGIWANEHPVFSSHRLEAGDDLRIGSVTVNVRQASRGGAPSRR